MGLLRPAEAGTHGVDENQVAGIQQAVGIVDVGVWRRRCQAVRFELDHLGTEGAHVQPDGGRAGSAIEQKPDRPLGLIADAVFRIIDVEQVPLGDAAGGLVDGQKPDMGGVLNGLAVQRDLVLRGDRFRRVMDGLHLFGGVVEAVEIVGGSGGAGPSLCASSHTRGSDENEDGRKFLHGMAP